GVPRRAPPLDRQDAHRTQRPGCRGRRQPVVTVRPRVVVTDHAFVHLDREKAAASRGGADLIEAACHSEADVIDATRGADVVVVNLAPITRTVLAGLAPGAAVIRYGTGYDNVDVEAAAELGIRVCVVAGYGTESVAEHAV